MESSHTSISTNLQNNSNLIEWNEKLEESAKNIGETAKQYKLMHIIQAKKTQKIYNRLMLSGIILGPFAGLNSGLHESVSPDMKFITTMTGTICGIISGVVVAIAKFSNYDEKSITHKQVAARYASIESNVRRQLNLYRNDRIPPSVYMEWLELKYEELFLYSPLLPDSAYVDYQNISKKIGVNVSNQYEPTITINNNYKNISSEITTPLDINQTSSIVDIDESSRPINDSTRPNNESTRPIHDSTRPNNESTRPIHDSTRPNNESTRPNNESTRPNNDSTRHKLPELDQYTDRMLQYELSRLMKIN